MPVYNDISFLKQALESLLHQSYSNFELIIADDSSTDGSSEICKEFALKDNRIRYIRHEKNIGISKNMEFLLEKASGEFFMWAANDDIWDKNFIAHLVEILMQNSKLVSAFCPVYFIDESNTKLTDPVPRSTDYSGSNAFKRLRKLITKFDDSFGYGLFRRDKILGVNFPVWWWINRSCPYNNIYPTLCFYLTVGDFGFYKGEALWYNRLKKDHNIHHKIPYDNSLIKGFLAFFLRKLNLVYKSIQNINKASGSKILIVRLLPFFLLEWIVIPCYKELKVQFYRFKTGKINLL